MIKRTSIHIIAIVTLATSITAQASGWWMLDFGSQKCISTQPFAEHQYSKQFTTPLALRDFYRAHPGMGYERITIHHLPNNGNIVGGLMVIFHMKDKKNLYYFSKEVGCLAVRKVAKEKGLIPNLNELR